MPDSRASSTQLSRMPVPGRRFPQAPDPEHLKGSGGFGTCFLTTAYTWQGVIPILWAGN